MVVPSFYILDPWRHPCVFPLWWPRLPLWRPVTPYRGRTFSERDDAASAPAVAINEAMARRFWPKSDPMSDTIQFPKTHPAMMTRGLRAAGGCERLRPFQHQSPGPEE